MPQTQAHGNRKVRSYPRALALASAAVSLKLAPGVSVVGEVPQGLPPIKLDVLSTTERVESCVEINQ